MERRRNSIDSIACDLLSCITEDVLNDLQGQDSAIAVEIHFSPVTLHALGTRSLSEGNCSTDGYYDPFIDPDCPRIFFANDVNKRRARLTILHELGHHLLQTTACYLLDDIDQLCSSPEDAVATEEFVCHNFAGRILVPEELLNEIIGRGQPRPEHVREIYERGSASWEAVAVRVAGRLRHPGAIVLMRDETSVSFCAPSPLMGWLGWRRESRVEPNGPLSRAILGNQNDEVDTYRYELGYAQSMSCEAVKIREGFAVAVLSELPSDRGTSLNESSWEPTVQFCKSCIIVERNVGWCEDCKGQRCPECDECGCTVQVTNPVCPSCHLYKPHRQGSDVCRDCE